LYQYGKQEEPCKKFPAGNFESTIPRNRTYP
jgi:hypothetical protein